MVLLQNINNLQMELQEKADDNTPVQAFPEQSSNLIMSIKSNRWETLLSNYKNVSCQQSSEFKSLIFIIL